MSVLAALAVLGVALHLTRDAWTRVLARRLLASALAAEVEIGALSWTGWHTVQVEALHVRGLAEDANVRVAGVRELTLELDVFELVRHGLGGLHAVHAEELDLDLDLTRAPASTAADERNAREPLFAAFTALPRVELGSATVRVRANADTYLTCERAALTLTPVDAGARVALDARDFSLQLRERTFAGPLALRAVLAPDAVELASCTWGSLLEQASGRLERDASTGALHIDARAHARAAELAFDGRVAGGRAEGRVEFHAPAIERLFSALELPGTEDCRGALDVTARVDVPLAEPRALAGWLEVHGRGVSVRGVHIDAFDADVRATGAELLVPELALLVGANELHLTNFALPQLSDDPCELAAASSGRFELTVRDFTELAAALTDADPASLRLEELTVHGAWADGVATIGDARLTSATGIARVRSGRVPLLWNSAIWTHPDTQLDVDLAFADLRELAPFTGGHDLAGRASGAVELRAEPAGLRGEVRLAASDIRFDGRDLGSADVRATLAARTIDVTELTLTGPLAALRASGRYDVARRRFEAVDIAGEVPFDHEDEPRPGARPRPRAPETRALVHARLAGAWPALEGWITVETISQVAMLANEERSAGDAALRARADDAGAGARARGDEQATQRDERVSQGGERAAQGGERASQGNALPRRDASVPEALRRVRPPPRGLRELTLTARFSGDELFVDQLQLATASSKLQARGGLSGFTTFFGPASEPPSACLRVDELSGSLAGRAFALQRAFDASWSPGSLTCSTIALESELGTLTADADWTASRARARVLATGALRADVDIDLPLDARFQSRGDAHVRADIAADDLSTLAEIAELARVRLQGRLALSAAFAGPVNALRGKLTVSADEVELAGLLTSVLSPPDARAALGGPLTLRGEIEAGDTLVLRGLEVEHARVKARVEGHIDAPLDALALVRSGLHAWDAAQLELRVSASGEDLAPVATLVPVLRRLGGRFTSELEVRGTGAQPEFTGHGTLADGELRFAAMPIAWTRLAARVSFERDQLTLDTLTGDLGGAPFSATGKFWPFGDDPRIDIELSGDNLLLARTRELRLRADTKLHVEGPLRTAHVAGSLVLRGSRFEQDFDLLGAITTRKRSSGVTRARPLFELDAPLDQLTFDVRVTSADAFRLENDFVRATLRPELQLQGTGALPFLRGRVIFEPSVFNLPAATVRLQSGSLEYLPSDPFVPRIEAFAEARVQGYDVKLHVTGTLQDPVVDISSIPPLAQDDLVLLVLTGRAPSTQLSAHSNDIMARSMSVYVARDLLREWLHGDLGRLLVDSLELETAEEVSSTGVESVRARLLVKELGDKDRASLYLTGERDVYEHYNFGVRILFRFK